MSPASQRKLARRKPRGGVERGPSVRDSALVGVVRPFLLAVMKVQRLGDAKGVDPSQVDRYLRVRLAEALEDLARRGLSEEERDDLRFALVVFVDEKMQDHAGGLEAYWSAHPWGIEMLGHARGGELFYERLARLRAEPERRAVLAVYHVCMHLGFYGAYRGPDEYRREEILDELRCLLDAGLDGEDAPLSPRASRPYEKEYDQKRNLWLSALVLAYALLSALVLVGLWAVVDMAATDLVEGRIAQGRED